MTINSRKLLSQSISLSLTLKHHPFSFFTIISSRQSSGMTRHSNKAKVMAYNLNNVLSRSEFSLQSAIYYQIILSYYCLNVPSGIQRKNDQRENNFLKKHVVWRRRILNTEMYCFFVFVCLL